jgi:outer membrane protein assembly factor BamB
MTRRLSLILGLVMALSITVVPIVGAHDGDRHDGDKGNGANGNGTLPARIDLPDGFSPEGITSGFRSSLYVGSVANGAIWRGDAKSGEGKILVAGVAGRQAAGLHLDGRGRLWVAGADNHTIRVYNAQTGELLQTYTFPTAGFINDLAITKSGVYATDSNNRQLAVVPLERRGKLPEPSAAKVLPLTGDYVIAAGFNANGIVAKHGWLILVQSNTGKLFRVDPKTGETKAINTGTYSVVNGDGLALRKGNLYVVRNQNNLVAVLKLGDDLLSASLVGEIKSPGNLDFPTTATFTHNKLWAVNARFTTPPTATTDYWITQLPTKP